MELKEYISGLKEMLDNSPSKYMEIAEASDVLIRAGFKKLSLDTQFPELHPGDKVFVTKNSSALFAFIIGEDLPANGMKVISAHSDFPCLQIKTNPEIKMVGDMMKLNIEPYGGPLLSTWFDRPLSISGRVFIREIDPYNPKEKVFKISEPLAVIPSLPFHYGKNGKDGKGISAQNDMMPVIAAACEGCVSANIRAIVAKTLNVAAEDILSMELCLYDTTPSGIIGNNDFLIASRIDCIAYVYTGLMAFTDSTAQKKTLSLAVWDNEECGSISKQGAASMAYRDVLERIIEASGYKAAQTSQLIENSFCISLDIAFSSHPNHPELSDATNRPNFGKGPVIKIDSRQKYATDAESEAVMVALFCKENIPFQYQMNNNDIPGGNTLASIAAMGTPFKCVDIGAPTWAGHSIKEITSIRDMYDIYRTLTAYFKDMNK